eukprot:Hpha_TRINITY_DN10391_c0_g1::TRINITY_DN10391_c0_g1_i1::g.115992::m.115992
MRVPSGVLWLAIAGLPTVTCIQIDSLQPLRVGLEGGARLTITGSGLEAAGRGNDLITVGGAPCLPTRMYSDLKHGRFCVCELPSLPEGDHAVSVAGVTNPALSVLYAESLTPHASAALSTLVGAAGDTLVVVGQNWNVGSYPTYQVRAVVGGHEVRPDEFSSTVVVSGRGDAIFHIAIPLTLYPLVTFPSTSSSTAVSPLTPRQEGVCVGQAERHPRCVWCPRCTH